MKTRNLCKIEFYRFFHSMEIAKYFVIVPAALFFMCYINIFYMKEDISTFAVWGSMSSVYMYIIAATTVLISVYVGREFHYKTIYYEVVKGYGICKIALSKTITCGIIVPCIYTLCMSVYLLVLSDFFSNELLFRILLLYIVYVHICSSSVLYVMICKSGVLGGIIAFIRFYLVEAMGQVLVRVLDSKTIDRLFQNLQVFNQWYGLIDIGHPIKRVFVFGIVAMLFTEYGLLLFLLSMSRKRFDF